MNSLQEMDKRRDAWLSEKPQGGGGDLLRGLMDGDEIFFWFAGNGDEGDSLIKIYRAHAIPTVVKNSPMTVTKYCLKQNDGQECAYCDQGMTDMKERMGMWLYITSILHNKLAPNTPPDKIPERIQYQGNWVFKEDINGFRLWDASAWRDSPWSDIKKLAEMYKGLHNFMAQMSVVGEKMQRRFKLYAMPQSPVLSPELYQQARQLKPVPDYLREQLATPVMVNPTAAQQQPANNAAANIPFSPAPAFSPFGNAAPAPAPVADFNPFASAAAPPAAAPTPPEASAPEAQQQAPTSDNVVPWNNNDEHKPLQSMF